MVRVRESSGPVARILTIVPKTVTPAQALQHWHEAVNGGDADAVLRWCADDVSIVGPRGTTTGHSVVRQWLQRSGIRLQPVGRLVQKNGRFVVRETARWTSSEAGGKTGPTEPVQTTCVFTVANGLVTSIARYDDPADVPVA